jgi:hypothetical protein
MAGVANGHLKGVNTSEEFASRYEYSPIGYRKIRLVELRREECLEAPDNQVKISVSFLEVALDSPPEYEALSYVWAAPAIERNSSPSPQTSTSL